MKRRSYRKKNRSKKRTSNSLLAGMSLLGTGLGAYAMNKYNNTSKQPRQGFVFTPNFESKNGKCLLIIDPQNDFMENGSLPVPNSINDMENIVKFIGKNDLSSIVVTLDTHSLFHIGNAFAYKDNNNNQIKEEITLYDKTQHHHKQEQKVSGLKDHIHNYTSYIQKHGKIHVLWPLHCLLGTSGHNVYEPLFNALKRWSEKSLTEVTYVMKGCDSRYENFSVFRSAGVDETNYKNPNKEAYKFNLDLANYLYNFEELYIAGEARTHCVADSTIDYINWVNHKGNPKQQKIIILWNCMSDIPSFEQNAEKFKSFLNQFPYVEIVNV